jgi:hypothetical protein
MRLKSLALLAAVAFFLVSPGFACGPGDPEYQYGAKEMKAAVEGDWVVTFMPGGGAAVEYTVHLQQAARAPGTAALEAHGGLVRAAHACGSRTLVASAGACTDSTRMPLDVTVAPGGPPAGTTSGEFAVTSTVFTRGQLSLKIGDNSLFAEMGPDGTVFSLSGAVMLRRL